MTRSRMEGDCPWSSGVMSNTISGGEGKGVGKDPCAEKLEVALGGWGSGSAVTRALLPFEKKSFL